MCVFIYLTNEALKPKGKIHGNFIRRNFLRNILGQRFIFDAENKYKFYAYLSLLGESTIKQQTTTSPHLPSHTEIFVGEFEWSPHQSLAIGSRWTKINFVFAHHCNPALNVVHFVETQERRCPRDRKKKERKGPEMIFCFSSVGKSGCACQPEAGDGFQHFNTWEGESEGGVRKGEQGLASLRQGNKHIKKDSPFDELLSVSLVFTPFLLTFLYINCHINILPKKKKSVTENKASVDLSPLLFLGCCDPHTLA